MLNVKCVGVGEQFTRWIYFGFMLSYCL